MRVVLLHEYFVPQAPGGAEWSTLELAERLADRGLETAVVTLDLADRQSRNGTEQIDRNLRERHIRVYRLPFFRKMSGEPRVFPSYILGNPLTERRLARALLPVIRELRPALLHVQGLGMLLPAHRVARRLALPLLLTVRDYRVLCPISMCLHRRELPPRQCTRARFRDCADEYLTTYGLTLSKAARCRYRVRRELEWSAHRRQARMFPDLDGVVYVSAAVRRIYEAAGLWGERSLVAHNLPPQTADEDDEVLRQRFGLTGPVVLFVGRWSLGKGAAELAAAWPAVRRAHPAAQLVIVGRREAAQDPREGAVFTGPLPHGDVLKLMRLAQIFVLPSRWPEPFARTALEAMAAARPVVATRAGGNPELIRDGENGLLTPRGDQAALAAALGELLADPERAGAMGEAGRQRLCTELAAETQLDRLVDFYRTAAAGKRLRICAPATSLTENTVQGGGYFHVKNLQSLADRGVHCLIPLAFRLGYQPRDNWDVRVVPVRRTYRLGALLANLVFGAAILWQRWGRGERFALLRIGDLYHQGPGALLAARLCRVPTVGVIHHIDHDRRRENAVVGWTARRLDGVLVPSRATRDDVVRTFEVEPTDVHVIVEGASEFPGAPPGKAAAKERFGLRGKAVIGFLGALQPRKNAAFLLEAFARVAAGHPRAHLLLVGEGPERQALEERARRLEVAESVTFTGRLFERDKAAALAAMDLFAFPSLNEGFGLAVVEAMRAGVPPVVSDRGSLPEVGDDGRTGRVVPVDDPAAWAQAMEEWLSDAGLRKRIGKAARRHAVKHFTWEACAAQSEAVFRRVLDGRNEKRLGVLLNQGDSLAQMRQEGQEVRFVDHYLRRYAAAFAHVSVFSYGADRARPLPNARFLPGRPGWLGPLYGLVLPLRYARLFRRLSLLRVMQTGGALPAVVARLLFGVPFVTTYGYRYGEFMRVKGRRFYGWWLDRLERLALRLAARVIVTTPSLREHAARWADPRKVVLLPNGVDLGRFQPAERRARPGKKTVLFVGRLTAQKNLPLLVQALAPLRQRVRLRCVGQGEMAREIERQAAAAGLELHLPGAVPHERIPALLREADLFALPSRIEGHPKALIEAMAAALPCVGTDAPGIRDVIVHEQNGLLTAPEAHAFGAAVARLLDDEALARRLGENARRAALEHYDLESLLAREIALLLETAGKD